MSEELIEAMCIAFNQVLLNQPEDERNQPKAMRAALAVIEARGMLAQGLRDPRTRRTGEHQK